MLNDFTVTVLACAMDGVMLRQTAIAYNISNANSLHAHARQVEFESRLAAAKNSADLNIFHPHIRTTDKAIALDTELARSLQNTTQFRALNKGLNQKLAIMRMALRGS